jgi:hypothetical protein
LARLGRAEERDASTRRIFGSDARWLISILLRRSFIDNVDLHGGLFSACDALRTFHREFAAWFTLQPMPAIVVTRLLHFFMGHNLLVWAIPLASLSPDQELEHYDPNYRGRGERRSASLV